MSKGSRWVWLFDREIPPKGSPKAEWDRWHADYDAAKAATQKRLALAADLAFDGFYSEACAPEDGCEWCKERADAIMAVYELAGLPVPTRDCPSQKGKGRGMP